MARIPKAPEWAFFVVCKNLTLKNLTLNEPEPQTMNSGQEAKLETRQ